MYFSLTKFTIQHKGFDLVAVLIQSNFDSLGSEALLALLLYAVR